MSKGTTSGTSCAPSLRPQHSRLVLQPPYSHSSLAMAISGYVARKAARAAPVPLLRRAVHSASLRVVALVRTCA